MEDIWENAPPGELRKLASLEQSRIYRRQLLQVGTTGIATLIVGVGAYQLLLSNKDKGQLIANIYCTDVINNLEAFHNNKLAGDIKENIEQHLEKCTHCKSYNEKHFKQA